MWKVKKLGLETLDEDGLLEFIHLNIVYASNHRERALGKNDISFPKAEALERTLFGQVGVITDKEGNIHQKKDIDRKASEAVYKRFIMEQAMRTKEVIEDLCTLKDVDELPGNCLSVLKAVDYIEGGHESRKQDVTWYISCFSDKDRIQAKKVMERAGCKNYILYQGIEECIEGFKV